MVWRLTSGCPRQFWVMKLNSPMLDLVPFAGPRREMADRELQSEVIGQALQRHLPEPRPVTVAPTSIGRDQQLGRLGKP